MQMVELNLNMIIDKSLPLINLLDKSINHPLIRKESNISINLQYLKNAFPSKQISRTGNLDANLVLR